MQNTEERSEKRKTVVVWTLSAVTVVVLIFLFFWKNIVISVFPGELGVKYSRFFGGTVTDRTYGEGIHFIWPFDLIYIYDTRILERSETVVALSKTGLPITVHVSCQYQLDRDQVPLLHQHVGPNYLKKIILPMMNTVTRQVIGDYDADNLYSTARRALEDAMMVRAVASTGRLPITIHNFVIKKIDLPEDVVTSIVNKIVAYQNYKRYEYTLLEAVEEAKRKQIEAIGIRNFQNIVNSGMTENYLRYQGIDATRALAASSNTKVVIAGGKDGLPLIFNSDSAADSATGNAGAAPAGINTPPHVSKPTVQSNAQTNMPEENDSKHIARSDDPFNAVLNMKALMDELRRTLEYKITPPAPAKHTSEDASGSGEKK